MPQPSLILMGSLISVFAGVVFGVMPLRQIFKTDPNDAIKSGGNQSSAGRRWALRDVLLAAQIALCCVTVTAAFVSLRGLGKALTMNMGINPKHAVLTKFELSQAGYIERGRRPLPAPTAGKSLAAPGSDCGSLRATPRRSPWIRPFPISSRNKPPTSGPRTGHLMPTTTMSRPDTSPPLKPRCSRDAM